MWDSFIPITEEEYFIKLEQYTSKGSWFILIYILRSCIPFALSIQWNFYQFLDYINITSGEFTFYSIENDYIDDGSSSVYPDCDENTTLPCLQLKLLKELYLLSYLGIAAGGVTCGFLSDIFGRRTICILLVSIWIALSYGVAFVTVQWFKKLLFIQMLVGFGLGIVSFINFSELFTKDFRILVIFNEAAFPLGYIYYDYLSHMVSVWFDVQLFLASFLFVLLFSVWYIPESPKWLFSRGKKTQALEILEELSGGCYVAKRTQISHTSHKYLNTFRQLIETIKHIWRVKWAILVNFVLMFCIGIICGSSYWSLVARNGGHARKAMSLSLSLGLLILYPIATLIGKQYGLYLSMGTVALMCLVTLIEENHSIVHYTMMLIVAGVTTVYSCFLWAMEMFPTYIRGSAVGLCLSTFALASVCAMYLLELTKGFTAVSVFLLLLACSVGSSIVVFLPETFISVDELIYQGLSV